MMNAKISITQLTPQVLLSSLTATEPTLWQATQAAQQLRAVLMNLNPAHCHELAAGQSVPDSQVAELIDIRASAAPIMALSAPPWSAPEARFRVRPEVAERLRRAAYALPSDLRIGFWEGFRPLAIQQALWNLGLTLLGAARPQLARYELEPILETCIARPDATARHSVGYAVDIAVVDETGHILDLSDARGRLGRQIFARSLVKAGLTNYAPEWWHWSYEPAQLTFDA